MSLSFHRSVPALILSFAVGMTAPFGIVDAAPVMQQQHQANDAKAGDKLQQIPHTLKALEEAKAGKYGKLKSADAHNLNEAGREIALLMGGHDDLTRLDADEKMRLFNAQETIMAVVSNMQRSRLVCKTVRKVGTRLGTRQCMTADMAEAQARAAKDMTHNLQNPMCVPAAGNPCATEGFHLRGLNGLKTTSP